MPDAFEKLQELVLDENKLVTYKTLCRTLDVPVNQAKQFLSEFFEQYGAKYELSVFYMLIGVTVSKKSSQQFTKAMVVAEDELEKAKSQYSALSSIHIYAVQKGKIVDENTLYNADYGKMELVEDYNKFSPIRNQYIHVRAGQQVKHIVQNDNSAWKPNAPGNQAASKNEPPKKSVNAKSKTSSLVSMFQKKSEDLKTEPKGDSNQSNSKSSPETEKSKKSSPVEGKANKVSGNTGTVKNDMKYFFAKQAEKPPKADPKAQENAVTPKTKSLDKTSASMKEIKKSPETKSSFQASNKKGNTEKSRMSKSKSKRQNTAVSDDDNDDFVPVKKKHKRIVTMDDSDSESENEQEQDKAQREMFDSEPCIPTSLPMMETDEEIIPPTPPVRNGKKSKWKTVTKTFEDEDGFFVTEKKKELVTDSEDSGSENLVPTKAQVKKESPKTSPVKKKQASLMSFFKQK